MSGNPWTISINYGPDGEQNYTNVFDGDERLVGNLRIHHANAVVTAVNSYASSQAEIERLKARNSHLALTAMSLVHAMEAEAEVLRAAQRSPSVIEALERKAKIARAALSGSKE